MPKAKPANKKGVNNGIAAAARAHQLSDMPTAAADSFSDYSRKKKYSEQDLYEAVRKAHAEHQPNPLERLHTVNNSVRELEERIKQEQQYLDNLRISLHKARIERAELSEQVKREAEFISIA